MADILKSEPLQAVQLEALVVMKIIKHCSQTFPTTATGFIVGMDNKGVLEVTNAFPFPTQDVPMMDGSHDSNNQASRDRAKSNTIYQNEMIRNLREVNIDANNVGWYSSTNMGDFVNPNLIDNQYHYQKDLNERTIALVHDVSRSSQGSLSLRAFRLSPVFMTAYKDKDKNFTTDTLQKSGLRYQDILIELPLQIHNSYLLTAFLHQLPSLPANSEPDFPSSLADITQNQGPNLGAPLYPNFDSLDLSIDPFLEKTCDLLLDSIETHHTELNNYQYHLRSLAREQNKISAWQAKRKAENASRAIAKQTLLPEDEWQRLFSLPVEPSRLKTMLNSRQVEQYARQVDGFTAGISGKMFAVKNNMPSTQTNDS